MEKSKPWRDLKKAIRNNQAERIIPTKRLHFCPKCGLSGQSLSNLIRHVRVSVQPLKYSKKKYNASHENLTRGDMILLDDIKTYYKHIRVINYNKHYKIMSKS